VEVDEKDNGHLIRPGVNPTNLRNFHERPRKLKWSDLETMHLPRKFWDAKRSELKAGSESAEFFERVSADVAKFFQSGEFSLAMFHGDKGHGVSSAAAILAKAARAHKFTVFYQSVPKILTDFMSPKLTRDEAYTAKERCYETDVLVLDDFGQGYSSSEYVVSETEALIAYRQDHELFTIIGTHLDPEQIEKTYGSYLASKLEESAALIECAHNFRWATGGSDEQ
jgi:DNA replication protein DnaC